MEEWNGWSVPAGMQAKLCEIAAGLPGRFSTLMDCYSKTPGGDYEQLLTDKPYNNITIWDIDDASAEAFSSKIKMWNAAASVGVFDKNAATFVNSHLQEVAHMARMVADSHIFTQAGGVLLSQLLDIHPLDAAFDPMVDSEDIASVVARYHYFHSGLGCTFVFKDADLAQLRHIKDELSSLVYQADKAEVINMVFIGKNNTFDSGKLISGRGFAAV